MIFSTHRSLPPEIADIQAEMEQHAVDYGLDFFETIFEMVSYEEMSMLAAFGGFPVRYPHWRFGAEYDELVKGYSYGLQKIYEMVINTDPCYAYLLQDNMLVDQKLVIAHVYGHCDFFKNNAWFAGTNRRMLDQMANHASRISRYIDRQGQESVEEFIDACLSLDNLIDPYSVHIERGAAAPVRKPSTLQPPQALREPGSKRFPSKTYMEGFINPPDVLDAEEQAKKQRDEESQAARRPFPEKPQRDVLLFLLEHAPLKDWQHDVLSIIRDEAYYFAPQGQTKILNEGWACLVASSRVFTSRGLITMRELVAAGANQVCDGETCQKVIDSHIIRDHATVTLRTRRGLTLTGSDNHRVLTGTGTTWRRLDELAVGDRVRISGGQELWAGEEFVIDWEIKPRVTLADVAEAASVSVDTVIRFRRGESIRAAAEVSVALQEYDSSENQSRTLVASHRSDIDIPETLTADFANLLGSLIGDGCISLVKRVIVFTTGDRAAADRVAEQFRSLFGVRVRVKRDDNRWRVQVSSQTLAELLTEGLGLTHGPSAAEKSVPEAVLRSPGPVVAAFLTGLFDADGYAGKQGVILSTKSEVMSKQVQLLLMNFGILSRRRRQADGCWHLHVMGQSAAVFGERIGFQLARKRDALADYVDDRRWFKREEWSDEIVSIEHGRDDVYDITVDQTHRYVAQGFINHNSFWHSLIMTRHGASDSDFVCFADHHSGTMAMSPTRLNPYKIGIELLRDIEERWNKGQFGPEWESCDDLHLKENWDRQLGLGREKIFEVRRVHNDVTFIDTFLTPEFCRKHRFFSFAYDDSSDYYLIASREFEKIKQQLLANLTNHGRPFIYVLDGNYKNRGELYLEHDFQGIDLRDDYARDTLMNLQRIWGRPVHLQTQREDIPVVLSYDGTHYSEDIAE